MIEEQFKNERHDSVNFLLLTSQREVKRSDENIVIFVLSLYRILFANLSIYSNGELSKTANKIIRKIRSMKNL